MLGRPSLIAVAMLFPVACSSSPEAPESTTAPTTSSPAAAASAAQAPEAPAQLGTITVSASGCSMDAIEGSISPGHVELTAVNRTDHPAAVHLWRIVGGQTYEDLVAFVRQEKERTEAGETGLGPPPWLEGPTQVDLAPNDSATLFSEVESGTYGIVCIREFDEPGELHAFATVGPLEVG